MGFKAVRPDAYHNVEGFLNLTKQSMSDNDCEKPVKLLQSFVRKNRLDG
jgi:hypothetical protein